MLTEPSIAKDFHALMDLMISLNHSRRRTIDPVIEKSLGPSNYLREFCTVHVNIGRCTGKTSYIVDRATKQDLIVTTNYAQADWLRKSEGVSAKVVPLTAFNSLNDSLRGHRFEAVYFDEPGHAFEGTNIRKSYFYEMAAFFRVHTIVMFGE